MRALLIIIALLPAIAGALGPIKYDPVIKESSERWLPGSNWVRYRAQLYQESRFDPMAVSPAGAAGFAQFMPGTWSDVAPLLGFEGLTPHVAEPAIEAGAFYLSKQMLTWIEPRPYIERRRLGEAGYNAGTGNIIQAQSYCRADAICGFECRHWNEISLYLHEVTGHHSEETIGYIKAIEQWLMMMESYR